MTKDTKDTKDTLKKYIISYRGGVEVMAHDENDAIEKAWIDEGVHGEDITSIRKGDESDG